MTYNETTLNLMRYNNHLMYITDLNHIRKSFRCHFCPKCFNNIKAVKAHEPDSKTTSYVLVGGFYNAQENRFNTIFKKYKKSLKNSKRANYKINYLEEFKLDEKDSYYP